MQTSRGWTGFLAAVLALATIAGSSSAAKADALLSYSTAGSIDTSVGVTGANVISFIPETSVSVDGTSNLPLGSFQVAALPANTTTTYNDTPFSITYIPNTYNGITLTDPTPITITGTLSGTETGPYQSSVVATFNPIASGTLELAGASSVLGIVETQKLLVPSSATGITTIEGMVSTLGANQEIPAPEPSTVAIFLSAVGGIGLRRLVQSRRQPKQG
jgi:hypothetical protein